MHPIPQEIHENAFFNQNRLEYCRHHSGAAGGSGRIFTAFANYAISIAGVRVLFQGLATDVSLVGEQPDFGYVHPQFSKWARDSATRQDRVDTADLGIDVVFDLSNAGAGCEAHSGRDRDCGQPDYPAHENATIGKITVQKKAGFVKSAQTIHHKYCHCACSLPAQIVMEANRLRQDANYALMPSIFCLSELSAGLSPSQIFKYALKKLMSGKISPTGLPLT